MGKFRSQSSTNLASFPILPHHSTLPNCPTFNDNFYHVLFSLVCDYKITMIYIDMFKFLFTYANVKHFQVFNFCWMLLKCLFAPMCEGYYLFYVLLRNYNDLVFLHLCHHQNMVFLLVPICYYLFLCFIFHFFIFSFAKVCYL